MKLRLVMARENGGIEGVIGNVVHNGYTSRERRSKTIDFSNNAPVMNTVLFRIGEGDGGVLVLAIHPVEEARARNVALKRTTGERKDTTTHFHRIRIAHQLHSTNLLHKLVRVRATHQME